MNHFSSGANPVLGKPTMIKKSGQNAKRRPFLPVEKTPVAKSTVRRICEFWAKVNRDSCDIGENLSGPAGCYELHKPKNASLRAGIPQS
jgi:hypothetical protein